jgi:hypothetical protein
MYHLRLLDLDGTGEAEFIPFRRIAPSIICICCAE